MLPLLLPFDENDEKSDFALLTSAELRSLWRVGELRNDNIFDDDEDELTGDDAEGVSGAIDDADGSRGSVGSATIVGIGS